ncbi:MAG: TraR/DksA family transcriptional regulator [Bdellovibrionota bacterium]
MKNTSSLPSKKSASTSATTKRPVQQSVEKPAATKGQLGLTPGQIEELESRLLTLKGEIKAALGGKTDLFNTQAHNESLIKGDDAEVAEKQRQSNSALQEMDMLKNRLVLVDRALKKIEHGVYGICEETEEPIGFERLSVIPWARYGVKVQELREMRLREYRVSRLRAEV